jgi:L-alanine-DL-glutamate epimerase-like enolase superfamily enzyme
MERREWLKTVTAAATAALVPPVASLVNAEEPPVGETSRLETEVVRLKLRHTWTTTMSSSDFRDTLHVRYIRDGITGYGEGAPIVRYHEDAASAKQALDGLAPLIASIDPLKYDKLLAEVFRTLEGQWAAKAALDIALMDWVGKRLKVPVHRLFGLDAADAALTTFSIGIDTPEITKQKVKEAEAYPVLKIKVGLDTDEQTIAAVRSVTDKPLRVDANEGWKDKETALRKIKWLETQGVEMIEQPMPGAMLEEHRWLRERVEMPIFADESCLRPADIPALAGAYDGINVKLDKAGGILQGYRMIQIARALGLRTMLGCMVSSSVSVTAAAQLSPLVDFADLDGNLLIANDPFTGVTVKQGKLVLPDGPGLGVTKVTA